MPLPFDPRLLLLALPLVLLFLLATRRRNVAPAAYPYVAVDGLFTANERAFLQVLEEAAPDYRIFGKVRLADVVQVRKGLSRSEWQGASNRIGNKHLDFVLCHRGDLSVTCVVELDDRSHERPERRARDAFLEGALAAARVPLVRVPSRRSYDVKALEMLLAGGGASGTVKESRPAPVERVVDVGT